MNRIVKSVCFNLDDPIENEMYQYSMKYKGFSTFIKRLIHNAMSDKVEKLQPRLSIEQLPNDQVVIKDEYLRQLI